MTQRTSVPACGRIVYKELFEEIQKIKPPSGGFKWAVSIKPYPTRDSTRIAKTDVLTVQRYEV
jgi:hypothetical protein